MVRTSAIHVIDALTEAARRNSAPQLTRLEAAVLVADVSGFTALAASLQARHGGRGADILSAIMDNLLGSLGQVAKDYGGRVVDQVGDSVLVLWVAEHGRTIEDVRHACLQGAKAMLDFSMASTNDETYLPLRIGVGSGTVELAMVGGLANRWELLVVGPAMLAAHQACTDVPTNACLFGGGDGWVELVDEFEATAKMDGWWILRSHSLANGAGSVARAVAAIDGVSWSAELRPVTVLFCSLVGGDEIAFVSNERIHKLTLVAQEAIAVHGGTVDNFRADDKGVSIVAAFGMHGGDAAAALNAILAAIDVRDSLRDLGTDSAIGIATGKVRVGIGDAKARTRHTLYGNAVNFAARCMQACRNEILCDEATRSITADSITYFAPEARKLKGLEDAGPVFGVGGIRQERKLALISDATPIAGRKAEKAAIVAFLEGEEAGLPKSMILEGVQGSGKSRMAAFAIEEATRRSRQPLLCRAGLLGMKTPLFAWRDPLADLLRRRARVMDLTLAEAERQLVLSVGGTQADIGLIASMFGRAAPSSLESEGDSDTSNARTLRTAMVAALLGDTPHLIVFEDAHWLDDTSIQLARDLTRVIASLRIMFVARTPVQPELTKVEANTVRLLLPDLDRSATADLAAGLLGPFDKKHPFVDWLFARSGGNPMFCRALVALMPNDIMAAALTAPGAWRKAQTQLDLGDMPATIEGALLARFGNLPATQLGVLKAASVIGGSFTPDTLISLGIPSGSEQIEADIAALVGAGILASDASLSRGGWRFADELTREVIYASLPGQLLVELHRRSAEYIERRSGFSRSGDAAQIAQHWLNADMPERAFSHLRRAGNEARLAGAYATAMGLWKTALQLLEAGKAGARGKGQFRRAVLNRDLAFVAWRLGEPETTINYCYASMAGLWPGAPETASGWKMMLGKQSLGLIWQILRPWKSKQNQSRAARMQDRLRMTNAVRLIEAFYFSQGTIPAATVATYAARIAERTGEAAYAARPYGFLGYAAGANRLDRIARFCFARSQKHCLKERDWPSLAQTVRGETMYFLTLGEWDLAIRRARFAKRLSRKLNPTADLGSLSTMIGMGQLMAGNLEGVRRTFEEVEALAFAKSNDHYLLFAKEATAQVDLLEGYTDRAETLLLAAQTLAKRTRDLQSSLIVNGLLANTRVQQGRFEEVAASASELIEQAEATPMVNFGTWYAFGALAEALLGVYAALGSGAQDAHKTAATKALALLTRFAKSYPVATPRACLLNGQLSALNGDLKRAVQHWEKGVRAAQSCKMNHDLARLHHALASTPGVDAQARAGHALESQAALKMCGVQNVPPFAITLSA